MKALLQTDNRWVGLILRVTLGVVMFPHGAQNLLGWFGGKGFFTTLEIFREHLSIPLVLAILAIIAESFGSVGLVLGFFTRPAAFAIASLMVGAVAFVHWQNGFFMNWFGQQQGEGFEYHILAFGIALALLVTGGGRYSADGVIAQRLKR